MPNQPIRTLVIDDSVFMRTVLKGALARPGEIEVIGSAQNGTEGLQKIRDLKPDVVTLDIEMPGLTGLEVLERVMKECPLPIVMVSTKTQDGAEMTFQALDMGAVDYVAKPLGDKGASLESFRTQVVLAVKTAYASNRKRIGAGAVMRIAPPRIKKIPTEGIVVAIGISAGGPATLHKFIPLLPKEFPPVLLTQHMPADFIGPFAKRLNDDAKLEVKEAAEGDELLPGRVLLASGDRHLKLARRGNRIVASLSASPKVCGFRPSVDEMFASVCEMFGGDAVALVMTGMGFDGADGMRQLKAKGAVTMAQDKESSIVYGMPKAAYDTGCVDHVLSLVEIPDALIRALAGFQKARV